MKDDYLINEDDIQTVIRHLKEKDPKNADRDYAIQLLEVVQKIVHDTVRSDKQKPSKDFTELIDEAREQLSD